MLYEVITLGDGDLALQPRQHLPLVVRLEHQIVARADDPGAGLDVFGNGGEDHRDVDGALVAVELVDQGVEIDFGEA